MRSGLALMTLALAACAQGDVVEPVTGSAAVAENPIVASVTGGGGYLYAGVLPAKFSLSAVQFADGTANGQFRHYTTDGQVTVDFTGEVTCLAVDVVQGRAWIGGIVKHNRSTDPDHTTAIHQPGEEIWFRVFDGGEGGDTQDRMTGPGFRGTLVDTSAEYCALRFWGNNGQPVTNGNIQIH